MHDLLFGQGNDLFGRFDVGRTHVHGDRFDRLHLFVRKLGKTVDSALGVAAVADRFDRAVVQIVQQRDVAVPFREGLLVDADPRHRPGLFAGLTPCDCPLDDGPGLIPP